MGDGTRSRLTIYMWGQSICYSEVFLLYTVRVLLNTFLSVVPGVLFGLVVYCGRGSYVAGKTLGQLSYPRVGVSVSMPCLWTYVRWVRLVLTTQRGWHTLRLKDNVWQWIARYNFPSPIYPPRSCGIRTLISNTLTTQLYRRLKRSKSAA
jgi:hypothetical protein